MPTTNPHLLPGGGAVMREEHSQRGLGSTRARLHDGGSPRPNDFVRAFEHCDTVQWWTRSSDVQRTSWCNSIQGRQLGGKPRQQSLDATGRHHEVEYLNHSRRGEDSKLAPCSKCGASHLPLPACTTYCWSEMGRTGRLSENCSLKQDTGANDRTADDGDNTVG